MAAPKSIGDDDDVCVLELCSFSSLTTSDGASARVIVTAASCAARGDLGSIGVNLPLSSLLTMVLTLVTGCTDRATDNA
jgi:hypothetical protein